MLLYECQNKYMHEIFFVVIPTRVSKKGPEMVRKYVASVVDKYVRYDDEDLDDEEDSDDDHVGIFDYAEIVERLSDLIKVPEVVIAITIDGNDAPVLNNFMIPTTVFLNILEYLPKNQDEILPGESAWGLLGLSKDLDSNMTKEQVCSAIQALNHKSEYVVAVHAKS